MKIFRVAVATIAASIIAAYAMAGVYDYSQSAASNTTIEGITAPVGAMPPSNVGPLFRAVAAALRSWMKDAGCGLNTTGSANAYVLNANSNPYAGALTFADGDTFGFIANFTNTGAATLNVETEGAKALRKNNDQALDPGDIRASGCYIVHYDESANSAAGAWLLETSVEMTASSVYTAADSANVNLDSATASEGRWMRIGNVVTVSIVVTTDATALATETSFELSLPVASNFAGVGQCAGSGAIAQGGLSAVAGVTASSANDTCVVNYVSSSTASGRVLSLHFTYSVI